MSVKGHWFGEVANVESDLLLSVAFWRFDREIEPLVMTSSVSINSHEEVIFKRFWFDDKIKVT